MPYQSNIICDSVNPDNSRLTAYVAQFPRIVNAEILRHRGLSFSSASSRAIPTHKVIANIESDPFYPVFWGKSESGMQAWEELGTKTRHAATQLWREAIEANIEFVDALDKLGVHKQIANRPLEAFQYITLIISGTNFDNFFALRTDPNAQPELRVIASLMCKSYLESVPKRLNWGEWHLPFGDKYTGGLDIKTLVKVCTARCARVSYNNFDGKIDYEADLNLYNRLLSNEIKHASPAEHVAKASLCASPSNFLGGWQQHRKEILGETITSFDISNYLDSVSEEDYVYPFLRNRAVG